MTTYFSAVVPRVAGGPVSVFRLDTGSRLSAEFFMNFDRRQMLRVPHSWLLVDRDGANVVATDVAFYVHTQLFRMY